MENENILLKSSICRLAKQSGFSLVEVMMVLGIVAVIGAGSMAVFSNSFKASKALDQKSKVSDLANEVRMAWSKKEICNSNLVTANVLSSSSFDASQLASISLNISKLIVSTPASALSVGAGIAGDPSVKLKAAKLGQFLDMSAAANPKTLFMSKLILSFEKDKNGQSLGPSELKDIEIPVMLETTASGNTATISSCYAGQTGQVTAGDAAAICTSFGAEYSYDSPSGKCVNSSVTNLQTSNNQLVQENIVLKQETQTLKTEVATLQTQIGSLASTLSSIQNQVSTLGSTVAGLSGANGVSGVGIGAPSVAPGTHAGSCTYTSKSSECPGIGSPISLSGIITPAEAQGLRCGCQPGWSPFTVSNNTTSRPVNRGFGQCDTTVVVYDCIKQ